MWEDWFTLGRLISDHHRIRKPKVDEDDDPYWYWFSRCKEYWMTLEEDPSDATFHNLKKLLEILYEKNWTIEPRGNFKACLKEFDKLGLGTTQGARTHQ